MPQYKLTYFNSKGRAEPIRMLFSYGGIKYTDDRIEKADWPKMKPTTPIGCLPILEIDGTTTICQSVSIARYAAREAGLLGHSSMDQTRADVIVDCCIDYVNEMVKALMEKDDIRKIEYMKSFIDVTQPKILSYFEKVLSENSSGFFIGKTLTWADVMVYNTLDRPLLQNPKLLDSYKNLKANRTKFENIPKIAEYMKHRPATLM